MANSNGGVVGKVNEVTEITQDAVITTFNSSGNFTRATHTTEVTVLVLAGGGGGGDRKSVV